MKDITLEALPRGNNRKYQITVTRGGLPTNITGWTVFFTMKRNYSEPDTRAVVSKSVTSHTDAPNGVTVLELLPNDTENLEVRKYYYDFKIITDDSKEYTLQKGTITVDYTVTRRDT